MTEQEQVSPASTTEAVLIFIGILAIIGPGLLVFEAAPQVPIFFVLLLLIAYSFMKRVPWNETEQGIKKGIEAGIIPIVIFLLIGILISIWMSSGTIPSIIYYSFQVIHPSIFVASIFVVTALVGTAVGSSFTTASTVGVSFMALGALMDMNLALVAGAVVSGALVGDKMSPLSDTTNLASSIAGVDLFEHIRHMLWTTIPAFFLCLGFYLIIGGGAATADLSDLQTLMGDLRAEQIVHPLALLPLLVIFIFAVMRVPAIPTIAAAIGAGLLTSLIFSPGYTMSEFLGFIQAGYAPDTGNEQLNSILAQGGIESMMFALSLLILTLSMGGVLSSLGLIEQLMQAIRSFVQSTGRLVTSTVGTGIGINLLLGEQYMSVILTGKAYASKYAELGLAQKNMSRALENGGTLINALIPYGVSGAFMASVLEVDVLAYAPFAVFCLIGPVLAILYGWINIGMAEAENERKTT
ncbi:putative tyrosine permease (NhaC family) [Salsuginibacillus halophilus]|uniref:Putative tyrosine permease (NhaC family) n=1 Tax=Salsuginibacillus halophilus TaxID=517424 RepID=A0A2P8HBD2_9BACI|nr:Na+/H+ antiporter NhaC [Salsuginibacillus halophilus]PSL43535.1 putative tyrosine permease (NhaC family) [Salsuginibacillus halophilus]